MADLAVYENRIRTVLDRLRAEGTNRARETALAVIDEHPSEERREYWARQVSRLPPPTSTPTRARPTTYNGIEMRSRLEAGFAAWLDQWHMTWVYEPQAFASHRGQYLPDFRIDNVPCSWMEPLVTVYVEVKPVMPSGDKLDTLKKQMAVIWDSEPDVGIVLAWPPDNAGNGHVWALVRLNDGQLGFVAAHWIVTTQGIGLAKRPPWGGPWGGRWWETT